MAILQINRTQNDILRDSRELLTKNVGISADNDTSSSLNLLKSTSKELSSMWDTMNTLLRKGFISTAFADGLDEIGILLQEPRQGFKRSMDLSTSNLKFYLDETFARDITDLLNRYYTQGDRNKLYELQLIDSATNPSLINLPANITITSQDGTIVYTTNNPITISNTQTFDYTPLIANGIGSSYNVSPNVLNKHSISSIYPILAKISDAIKVKNTYAIRNGGDIENDENYRFRLSNKVVSAVSGNNTAIRTAVLSVPGIVDMSLIPRTHGNGTFTIFPKSLDPILSDGLINAVIASVQNVLSEGTLAYVETPNYLALSIAIELRFAVGADKNAIYTNARLSIMDYINNLDLGGEIIINEIIQRIMSLDDKILDMDITQFGFGDYARTTGIISNYIPLRVMNQRADWNEKWYTNSSLCSICATGER